MARNEVDLTSVKAYYSQKIAKYGCTPNGVDWNGESSQELRFKQLTKIIEYEKSFSVIDIGCGYGALWEYLRRTCIKPFHYTGCDVSQKMVEAARTKYQEDSSRTFIEGSCPSTTADYCIASGIFNVMLDNNRDIWINHIYRTLDLMNECSKRGFSFNCLTSYSDRDRMKGYLFYADPCVVFDHCKRSYSKNIALLHDYSLYEFTMIVKKE